MSRIIVFRKNPSKSQFFRIITRDIELSKGVNLLLAFWTEKGDFNANYHIEWTLSDISAAIVILLSDSKSTDLIDILTLEIRLKR
jgi:hypothetical protein